MSCRMRQYQDSSYKEKSGPNWLSVFAVCQHCSRRVSVESRWRLVSKCCLLTRISPRGHSRHIPAENPSQRSYLLHAHRNCGNLVLVSNKETHGKEDRRLARNSRADGTEDPRNNRAATRVRNCSPDRANQRRSAVGELRDHLSGSSQTGAGGLHLFGMGSL